MRFLSLFLLLFVLSCGKKEQPDPNDPKNYSQQIVGKWKFTQYTCDPAFDIDGDGTVESNIYPFLDSCSKKEVWEFAADKGFYKYACLSSDEINWNISDYSSKLILQYTTPYSSRPNDVFEIVSISPSTLVLRRSTVGGIIFMGGPSFTYSFNRQ